MQAHHDSGNTSPAASARFAIIVILLGLAGAGAAETPRPEHPRPILKRERWLNLNGLWQFDFDDQDRGLAEGWHTGRKLAREITVPFSFEAPLSGIGDTKVHPVVWYRRTVDVPEDFLREDLLLNIGACDWRTRVWVNGRAAGEHTGGYTPIALPVAWAMKPGENEIVIRAEDHPTWEQPRGKQIIGEKPSGIDYDRTTGIWQTVWLEPAPRVRIDEVWTHYRLDGRRLAIDLTVNRPFAGGAVAELSLDGRKVAAGEGSFDGGRREVRIEMTVPEPKLWSPEGPVLYDLEVSLREGERTGDRVASYTGLREWRRDGNRMLLNDKPFYFRAVLDQGYFPGGWYTAATDADLRRDIELMKAIGLNGARKHQKVEDPRWLYWADRLGFVTWGEMGNGRRYTQLHVESFTAEWIEAVRRDRGHPCIMNWVPINESWGVDDVEHSRGQQEWLRSLYHLTLALDGTRPVIANDGWQFVAGDIWGIHSYAGEGSELARRMDAFLAEPTTLVTRRRQAALPGAAVAGLPVILTEFGGVGFRDPRRPDEPGATWGYGEVPKDPAAYERRVRGLTRAVLGEKRYCGYVYTQLTDVQQEVNGLFYFDRTPKLPVETLKEIFSKNPE